MSLFRKLALVTFLFAASLPISAEKAIASPWVVSIDLDSLERFWNKEEIPSLAIPMLKGPFGLPVATGIELSLSSALTPELKYKLGYGNTWVWAPQLGAIIRL